MSDQVPAGQIEGIVGRTRGRRVHYGRAVSAQEKVYVLHSFECLERVKDLRSCMYSVALNAGIDSDRWRGFEDEAVVLYVEHGRLLPLGRPRSQ